MLLPEDGEVSAIYYLRNLTDVGAGMLRSASEIKQIKKPKVCLLPGLFDMKIN